jgi:hypothetical protein
MGEMRSAYKILVGKPERKRPLGRPMRRWEDNIKMDLKGIGWEVCALAGSCEHGNEISGCIEDGGFIL